MESSRQTISEKGKENLRRIAELRRKDSKYIKLQAGEKITLYFNAEKIEPVESEFNGKKTQRYQYTVLEPDFPEDEKYFPASKRTSEVIDTHLTEGRTLLKVQRIGAGKDTQYIITPAA
jgi:hypothetical protein